MLTVELAEYQSPTDRPGLTRRGATGRPSSRRRTRPRTTLRRGAVTIGVLGIALCGCIALSGCAGPGCRLHKTQSKCQPNPCPPGNRAACPNERSTPQSSLPDHQALPAETITTSAEQQELAPVQWLESETTVDRSDGGDKADLRDYFASGSLVKLATELQFDDDDALPSAADSKVPTLGSPSRRATATAPADSRTAAGPRDNDLAVQDLSIEHTSIDEPTADHPIVDRPVRDDPVVDESVLDPAATNDTVRLVADAQGQPPTAWLTEPVPPPPGQPSAAFAPPAVNLDPLQAEFDVGSYAIQVGDQVELKFLYRPDLNESLTVGKDGVISPAITHPVLAAGKTVFQLKQELSAMVSARQYNSTGDRGQQESVEYLIAVDDVIEVRFSVLEELSDTVTVRPDGKISLARIGEIKAEGKTPMELQGELEVLYEEKVRQPELVVIMRKTTAPEVFVDGRAMPLPLKGIGQFAISVTPSAPRVVYVMGEVNLPSAVPYYPDMTAIRAIGAAGGTKRSANLKHVMILRKNTECSVQESAYDLRPCRDCTDGVNSRIDGGFADITLRPNDVIVIPKTKIAKLQDWLDQYVYNLFPPLRNSSAFSVIYNEGIPGFNNP